MHALALARLSRKFFQKLRWVEERQKFWRNLGGLIGKFPEVVWQVRDVHCTSVYSAVYMTYEDTVRDNTERNKVWMWGFRVHELICEVSVWEDIDVRDFSEPHIDVRFVFTCFHICEVSSWNKSFAKVLQKLRYHRTKGRKEIYAKSKKKSGQCQGMRNTKYKNNTIIPKIRIIQ